MASARLRRGVLAVVVVAAALLPLSLSAEIAAGKPRHTLAAGKTLPSGQALVAGSARLAMRENGDLGVYVLFLGQVTIAEMKGNSILVGAGWFTLGITYAAASSACYPTMKTVWRNAAVPPFRRRPATRSPGIRVTRYELRSRVGPTSPAT